MVKVRVPITGTIGKSISIDPSANEGATIGVDFHLPDGSVPTLAQLATALGVDTSSSQTPGLANTLWRLVGEIPSDPLSVLGNPTAATLKPIAIVASADKAVLHRSGAALSFSPVDHTYISDFDEAAQDAVGGILVDSATIDFTYTDATPSITASVIDDSITNAKLRNSAATSVIGRSANSIGDPADIVAGTDDTILRQTASALSFGQLTVGMFPNDVVTYAKIQNVSATSRVLGRISSGAGDIEELTASNLATIVGTALGANPSASVGLTAVNGSAGTYMRSDAAPALDQGIAPTWTDLHIFSRAGSSQLNRYNSDAANGPFVSFSRSGATKADIGNAAAITNTGTLDDFAINTRSTRAIVFAPNEEIRVKITAAGEALFSSGTVSLPGIAGLSDPDSGLFWESANVIAVACAAAKVLTISGGGLTVRGDITIDNNGNGVSIKEGANAKMGTATLSGGTVTVNTTAVTANSRIFTFVNGGTLTNVGFHWVSARTAATSFTITSSNASDASTIVWILFEPA